MENLLAFVVFLIIAGVSMAQKAREARRKAEEESMREVRKPHPELPEATRRILYGENANIPTARPRQDAGGPPPLVVARPAAAPPLQRRESAPGAAPGQGRPLPRLERRPGAPAQGPMRPRPVPMQRPVAAPPPVPRRMPQPAVATVPVMETEGRADAESSWAEAQRRERELRQAAQPRKAAARAPGTCAGRRGRLFGGGGRSLARAMVLREVLGPPLSLQSSHSPGAGHLI